MKINLIKIEGELSPYRLEDTEKLKELQNGVIYEVDVKNFNMRTAKQNRALHLYCKFIAEDLNSKGLYISNILKVDTSWTPENVKENIFKPVMKNLYKINSTTKLKKDEFNNIIDAITLAFAKKKIVIPQFPQREDTENEK